MGWGVKRWRVETTMAGLERIGVDWTVGLGGRRLIGAAQRQELQRAECRQRQMQAGWAAVVLPPKN